VKETETCEDRAVGWIETCDQLNSSLEKAHSLLAQMIGITLKEANEDLGTDSSADNLEQRISKAVYLARGMASGMQELADKF